MMSGLSYYRGTLKQQPVTLLSFVSIHPSLNSGWGFAAQTHTYVSRVVAPNHAHSPFLSICFFFDLFLRISRKRRKILFIGSYCRHAPLAQLVLSFKPAPKSLVRPRSPPERGRRAHMRTSHRDGLQSSRALQIWPSHAVFCTPAEFYCQALMRIVSMIWGGNPMIIFTFILDSQGQKPTLVTIARSESKRRVVVVAITSRCPRCDPNQGGVPDLR
jgi:hypothetical protein